MSDLSKDRSSYPLMTAGKGAGIGAILLMLAALAMGPIPALLVGLALYIAFFFKLGSRSVVVTQDGFGESTIDNVAFAEWRASEIADIERRKAELDKSEAEFAAYLQEQKEKADRKEFERFTAWKNSENNSTD